MIESYNDGILHFYLANESQNIFGAKINVKRKEELKYLGSAFFKEETRRTQDFEFAEGINHKLTLKVKIPCREGVTNNLKILIDNYLYDLIHFDNDKKKNCIYLYLEEVGKCD